MERETAICRKQLYYREVVYFPSVGTRFHLALGQFWPCLVGLVFWQYCRERGVRDCARLRCGCCRRLSSPRRSKSHSSHCCYHLGRIVAAAKTSFPCWCPFSRHTISLAHCMASSAATDPSKCAGSVWNLADGYSVPRQQKITTRRVSDSNRAGKAEWLHTAVAVLHLCVYGVRGAANCCNRVYGSNVGAEHGWRCCAVRMCGCHVALAALFEATYLVASRTFMAA